MFETTAGVVDVDDYLEADQVKYVFTVDRAKAALAGIPSEEIVRTLRPALEGEDVGLVHIPKEKQPVQVRLRLPIIERTGLENLGSSHCGRPPGTWFRSPNSCGWNRPCGTRRSIIRIKSRWSM